MFFIAEYYSAYIIKFTGGGGKKSDSIFRSSYFCLKRELVDKYVVSNRARTEVLILLDQERIQAIKSEGIIIRKTFAFSAIQRILQLFTHFV